MSVRCYFIPKHIEDRICEHNKDVASNPVGISLAPKTSNISNELRSLRQDVKPEVQDQKISSRLGKNYVYTAKNRQRQPGGLIADSMNEATASKDPNAICAWVLSDYFLRFCRDILGRSSFDGRNADIKSTVHYYVCYNNAFFDGTQMVYGDGDGKIFEDFAQDPSVVFHELWHGVTDRTCGLLYHDQAGALNESLSDVFASIIMQWMNGETVDEASWLIGERCFIDSHNVTSNPNGISQAYALRSLIDPGTAFVNHPYIGTDDQPQDMDHFDSSNEDNGGVHKNSGITNHAFYLFAKSVGGFSWDIPCKIWYKTITTPGLISPNCTFVEFAQATLTSATDLYSSTQPIIIDKLRRAWSLVKIL